MHIPDGFLDFKTLLVTNVISYTFLFYAIRKVNKQLNFYRIPLIGVVSTVIFVVSLISVPVIGGTTTHLTGSVLTAVLLGPYTGSVVMFCVLLLQAILFQHGGLLSLGTNFLNIGITGCVLGYLVYKIYPRHIFVVICCIIAYITGAIFCVAELYFSNRLVHGTIFSLGMMSITNFVTGLIEGVVSFSVLEGVKKIRPDLLNKEMLV